MHTAYLHLNSCPYCKRTLQPIVIRVCTARHVLNDIRTEDAIKDAIWVVADAHVVVMDYGMLLCP